MAHTLVTIPISHFCEKARWSLDMAGIAYREEAHFPLWHRGAVRRVGGVRSVPVLALEDGNVLSDSPLIVRFADARAADGRKLLPTDERSRTDALARERHFDVELAPHVRRFAYFHVLPSRRLALRLFDGNTPRNTPRREQVVSRALFPVLRAAMRRFMAIDAPRALESRDRVRRVFDDLGARVERSPFLMGDRFTAVDITFAALASPILLPAEHPIIGGLNGSLASLPLPFANEVRRLRETPAGQFALRLYRDHRRAGPPRA